jgi:uncharacterized protein (DUF1697 family)
MADMALVVLLRGVNVGGHRRFRPSTFAQQLRKYDIVNLGATGTFVVWKPGPKAKFRAELFRKLPPDTAVALCDGREFTRLVMENPFGKEQPSPDVVRFVSVLTGPARIRPILPITFPSNGEWLVRVLASSGRSVFGEYRRHMKTITYLSQIDKLFGVRATTRSWNTILAIVEILEKGSE